jgi:HK97 family phage prohead protease
MKKNLTAAVEKRVNTSKLAAVRLVRAKGRQRRDDDAKVEENDDAEEGKVEESEDEEKEKEESDDDETDEARDGPGTIEGYAAVFHAEGDPGTEYELFSDEGVKAIERIAPGAFRDAIERPDDCRALFNHEPDQLLGRTASGTLRVEEDERGLKYSIDLPDTQAGRDTAELVARGDITGSSFGFVVDRQTWSEQASEDGGPTVATRTIESVRLLDVGPVTYPAYSGTEAKSAGRSMSCRCLGDANEARASYAAWKESRRITAMSDERFRLEMQMKLADAAIAMDADEAA